MGLAPDFFAFLDKPVATVDGPVDGPTMFISLSLSRIFTQREFCATIAHEIMHLHCGHSEGRDLGDTQDRRAHRRRQEFQADLGGSRVAGRHEMAAALVKAAAYHGYAAGIMGWYMNHRRLVANFSELFAEIARLNAQPRVITWLQRLDYYFRASDGKGSTTARLDNLQVAWDEVESAALHATPQEPASTFISGYKQIEEQLTDPRRVLAIAHPLSFWSEPLILPERAASLAPAPTP